MKLSSISTQSRKSQKLSRSKQKNQCSCHYKLNRSLSNVHINSNHPQLSKFYVKNLYPQLQKSQLNQNKNFKRVQSSIANHQRDNQKHQKNTTNIQKYLFANTNNQRNYHFNNLTQNNQISLSKSKKSLKQINIQYRQNKANHLEIKTNKLQRKSQDILNLQKQAHQLILSLKSQNQYLKQQINMLKNKLITFIQKQVSPSQAKPLDKFKKAVKTNRINQLFQQNLKIKQKNIELNEKNLLLKKSVSQLQQSVQNLKRQKINSQKLLMENSLKYQEYLTSSKQQLFRAKNDIKRLQIQLNNEKRKKQVQLQNYQKIKQLQYGQLKDKYLNLLEKNKRTRKQLSEIAFKGKRQQHKNQLGCIVIKKETNQIEQQNSLHELSLEISQDQKQI